MSAVIFFIYEMNFLVTVKLHPNRKVLHLYLITGGCRKIVLHPPLLNLCLREAAAILSSVARGIPITQVEACC